MSVASMLSALHGSVDPGLTGGLRTFRSVQEVRRGRGRRVVAVVGLSPGEGRSTVAAVLALTSAGYSNRRTLVIDTVPAAGRRRSRRSSVTEKLGGRADEGRLDLLTSDDDVTPVRRAVLAQAVTPHTTVPVLGLPPDADGFPPQLLHTTLARIVDRADLVVIDTPAAPRTPVMHAVLDCADHLVLVARADRDAPRRLTAAVDWVRRAPGPQRDRSMSLVLAGHTVVRNRRWRGTSGWTTDYRHPGPHRTVQLRHAWALAADRIDSVGTRAVTDGLRILRSIDRGDVEPGSA